MDPKLLIALLAFLGGAALPVQMGVNGSLRRLLGVEALSVAAVSFSVGAVAAAIVVTVLRLPLPAAERLGTPSWWMWFAGCCGVFYVWTTIMAGPAIGAVLAVSLAVLGQLVVSAALDHFGWLGFPQSSLSAMKIAGIMLVFGGVVLIGYARNA
jgi:bacterial/archaeal transporter family-2 protein